MKKLNLVRSLILAGSLGLQLSILCSRSHAAAGDVDLSFDPGSGVNGTVRAIVMQPDGKVIIGGQFTTVRGLARTNLARLNADGSGDGSFNAGSAASPWFNLFALTLQADGRILVGHDAGLSRFHPDGSLDTDFTASINEVCDADGCYLYVNSIAVQPDGKVFIAGAFSTGTGTNYVSGLARLNADGSRDSSFKPVGADYWTFPVALQPDGRILVGGYTITNVCDAHGCYDDYRYTFARLNANGSRDGTFSADAGLPWIQKITPQSDGKVLVVGGFTNGNLARLNADGSRDDSFNPVAAGSIESVAVQSDGQVLIGGGVDLVNGSTRRGIARLSATGSLDGSFDPGAGFTVLNYPPVHSVIVQDDGRILICGNFISGSPTNHSYLDRLDSDGSPDDSFNPGRQVDEFSALAVQTDGKVLIGGPLTFINGTNHYGSARLNVDGTRDGAFVPSSFYPAVGDLGFPFHPGFGDYMTFTAAAPQPDGKVLVAGIAFHYECDDDGCVVYDGYFVTRHYFDGTRDISFTPALGNRIYGGGEMVQALAVQPDGKILVGGWFHAVNGTNRNAIVRLHADGTLDTNSALGIGGSYWDSVSALAVQSDGKVLVNGGFATAGGANLGGIARLNADTSLDTSFNPAPGAYGGPIALQPDGKVIVGLNRLHADGSLDTSFNAGTGANGAIRSIALQPDRKLLIGGDFTTVNGVARPHVARLLGDSAAPALNLAQSGGNLILSWPLTALSFQLQETTNLALPNSWSPVLQPVVTNETQISVTIPANTARKFFRLKSQ